MRALAVPQRYALKETTIPAPMGGLNTISSLAAMPKGDAILLWNLVGSELGLRVRLGWYQHALGLLDKPTADGGVIVSKGAVAWATGVTYAAGAAVYASNGISYRTALGGTSGTTEPTGTGTGISDGGVTDWESYTPEPIRTIIPFRGASSANDKVFAVTKYGIYDVTAGGASVGAPVYIFPTTVSGRAGWGTHHAIINSVGHFMAYCDEEWGYFTYSEATGTWNRSYQAATVAWAPATAYSLGDRRTNGGLHYICVQAGTSAGAGGPTGRGRAISDGTPPTNVLWDWFPDITSSDAVDPAEFAACVVWKHRLWLIRRGTAYAYVLDLDSFAGTATRVSFAGKFRTGGFLVNLWSWTYDGGAGIDDRLVGVSSSGDVVIYEGTDPTVLGAFELKGVWNVGSVPSGRRIATEVGGDLLLLTGTGALPLSKLVIGNLVVDRSQYVTYKISSLFSRLVSDYGSLDGWSVKVHPTDNVVMITIPGAADGSTEQLVMSIATKGWSRYRELPILSSDVFQGKLYFGTPDGVVAVNDSYCDATEYVNPAICNNIKFAGITAYDKLGSIRHKQVQVIRGSFSSEGSPPNYRAEARYKYDTKEPDTTESITELQGALWDFAKWDEDLWPDVPQYLAEQRTFGSFGMGPEIAIAFSGKSATRCVVIGFDVAYTEGGIL